MTQPFVHLRVQSDYSFGKAASQVDALIKQAVANGQPALALTDEHNLHGVMTLADKGAAKGIQPIVGVKLFMPTAVKDVVGSVVLLAQSEIGYINICRIHNLSVEPGRKHGLLTPDILKAMKMRSLGEGVICLAGCGADGLIGRMLSRGTMAENVPHAKAMLKFLPALFEDRVYVEICRNGHPDDAETEVEKQTLKLALELNLPIVGTSEVLYSTLDRHDAYLVSQAVAMMKPVVADDDGTILDENNRRFHLRSTTEMRDLFLDLPEAFEQASAIAQRCAFGPSKRKEILPPFKTEGGRTEAEEMEVQAKEGLERRLVAHGIPESDRGRYHDRLAYELGIISKMGFPGYFLIVSDFIKWAKLNDIPVGPGRGSGAGSVVAWSLEITDLDPIRFGLLFERFLNPDRVSMPDFDVDFCTDRCEEVIQYVSHKYGVDCVARIATFTQVKAKSALKDAGRVVQHKDEAGLGVREVNELTSLVHDKASDPKTLAQVYAEIDEFRSLVGATKRAGAAYRNALKIEGLFRTSSMHAAGVVIADKPLTEFVPVGFDEKTGTQIAQFNMKEVEKSGLVKFDFLALKNLTVIKHALNHIKATKGIDVDISTLPLEDAEVYAMLAEGRANGVFQFESAGMKDVLTKMRVSRFEDLIAAVSLFRPGPMEMIPTYCKRKLGAEVPVYPEPVDRTKPFLEETFGIMVYQEQVMKVAQEVAGYSLGQADLLRRAMGKKIPEEMAKEKGRFIEGATSRGTPDKKAAELFDLIEKFAGYGFNKSHAAAYALIAYQTAWLKCRYPVEYFSALLSYEKDAERKSLIKGDMDAVGVEFLQPDINRSKGSFAPEQREDGTWGIRFGLTAIGGISAIDEFLVERETNGPFTDIFDFSKRGATHFNTAQLKSLASAGAFDCLSPIKNRKRLREAVVYLAKHLPKDNGTADLFGGAAELKLTREIEEAAEDVDSVVIQNEFDAVGFFFREHPLDRFAAPLHQARARRRKALCEYMLAQGKAQMQNMTVYGLVENIFINFTKRDRQPYVRFDLVERGDRYALNVFSGRGKLGSVDEIKSVLKGAADERKAVVVVVDLALKEGGEIYMSVKEIHDADAYLQVIPRKERVTITVDPRPMRFDPDTAASIAQITEAAKTKAIPIEIAHQQLTDIYSPLTNGVIETINGLIDDLPESEDEMMQHVIHYRVIHPVGDDEYSFTFDKIAPTRRFIDGQLMQAIGTNIGVVGVETRPL